MRSYRSWTVVGLTLTLGLLGGVGWLAAEEHTLEGEIVDPAGYLKNGAHGSDLADQTYLALDGGQSLALLETATNTLYLLLAEEAGEDPNELVYDYVSQKVRAKGTVYERGGMHGLVVTSAEPLEAQNLTTEESPPEP